MNNKSSTPQMGSVGRSSAGSGVSQNTIGLNGGRSAFQDDQRLNAAIKLYSTLEGVGRNEFDDDIEKSSAEQLKINTEMGAGGTKGSRSHSRSSRDLLIKFENSILERLFQINHVLLSNQAVSVLLFHLILLLSFLQILFNIFYKVEIVNEFKSYESLVTNSQNDGTFTEISDSNNTTLNNITESLPTFRLDQFFIFINFQYTVMQDSTDSNSFLTLYAVLAGIFVGFSLMCFAISGRVFEASKTEDIKEGTKLVIRFLSIVMCLLIYLLQIPLITMMLQGYVCDEEAGQELALASIRCDSTQHQILVVISSFMLIIFLGFLLCQQILYCSNSFDGSAVPWGSFERTLATIRVFIKIVISIGFVFDKSGQYRSTVNLACFFLQAFIVIKRQQNAIIFNTSVFYAIIIYETMSMWFFLTVALQTMAGTQFCIASVTLLFLAGLALGLVLIWLQIIKKEHCIVEANTYKFDNPLDYMIYFFRIHEIIESTDSISQIIMHGKLREHIQDCASQTCPCLSLLSQFDNLKRLKLLRFQEDEELRGIEYDSSGIAIHKDVNASMTQEQTVEVIILANQSTQSTKGNKTIGESVKQMSFTKFSEIPLVEEVVVDDIISNGNNWASAKFTPSGRKRFGQTTTGPIILEKPPPLKVEYTNLSHWLAQKRKLQRIEDRHSELQDTQPDFEKAKKKWYKFITVIIKEAIEKFPKNIDLRIINGYVQKDKLGNEFKAIFEMMNCELCKPTLYEQFVIFRKKIEVEQTLVKQHQKNIQKIGMLDVAQVFKYEKLFQKYQLCEFLTTHAALCFWKELLQKQINASVLQSRGSEISKYYEIIQDVSNKLRTIYPEEIKFLFRYGTFLLNIIHNEYEALEIYQHAQTVFQSKMNKKGNKMPVNEQTIFGENSASAIVIISATSTKIGTIINTNDEIEYVLGYKRKELIGKNVSVLMPRPIAKAHDQLVSRYFETAKPTVIEIKRQLFASSKEGYLREIELLVKVFPQVNAKIVFVGLIQRHDRYDEMEAPNPDFEKNDKQYIVTDQEGNITNVTEGLYFELGLHAKFFHYTDSIFQQMFNISRICSDCIDPENMESLEMEGKILQFDTRDILNNIELEALNSDEILEVQSNLGVYHAYVQLKKMIIHAQHCKINIYRVILLSKQSDLTGSNIVSNAIGSLSANANELQGALNNSEQTHESFGSAVLGGNQSVSSMSSGASTSFAFNRVIKDFKKALGDRQTPKNLVTLNRIMLIILLALIALSSIDFAMLRSHVTMVEYWNQINLKSEERTLKVVELSANVRSFINIANGIEFDRYEGTYLQPIDRFEYLGRIIQDQATDLQEIHEYLTQQRGIEGSTDIFSGQSDFEYESVDVFRLDDSNSVNTYSLPYRVSMQVFLNHILSLNATDRSKLVLPQLLLQNPPSSNLEITTNTTLIQKSAYFLITNGIRSLRTKSVNSTRNLQNYHLEYEGMSSFLAIMIIGIIMTFLSFVLIIQQIWMIEQNKAEILSLYALLQMSEINKVYNSCDVFMDALNSGSFLIMIQAYSDNVFINEESALDGTLQNFTHNQIGSSAEIDILKHKNARTSLISEDDMEAERHQQKIEQKKRNQRGSRRFQGSAQISGRKQNFGSGNEFYAEIIRCTFAQIRKLGDQEDSDSRKAALDKKKKVNFQSSVQDHSNKTGQPNNTQIHKKKTGEKQSTAKEQDTPAQVFSVQPSQKKSKSKNKKNKSQNIAASKAVNSPTNHKRSFKVDFTDGFQNKESLKQGAEESKSNPTSDESMSDDEKANERMKKNLQKKKAQELNDQDFLKIDLNQEDIEERKQFFYKTIQTKNWGKVITSLIISIIFAAYFIQQYALQSFFNEELSELNHSIPLFFNRFRYLILGYSFIREKIINNNTLESFETDSFYGHNIDNMYVDLSMENEQQITFMKIKYYSVIGNMVDQIKLSDSEKLCRSIVGSNLPSDFQISDPNFDSATLSSEALKAEMSNKPYQLQVQSVAPVQYASMTGNVTSLRALRARGVDLNKPNYDKRIPLHFAAKNGSLDAVKYLVSVGATINYYDRWQATAMSYARPFPAVYEFLKSSGGIEGQDQGNYQALSSVYQSSNLTDDDYRSFYAAYFNDLDALKILSQLGLLKVLATDQDGRTSLAVAASQGSLDAVKFLVRKGANPSIRDARNVDTLQEAKLQRKFVVVEFLQTIMSEHAINDYCIDFSDGLLRKGLSQSISNFHKRFADLQIRIKSAQGNYNQLLSLLNPPKQGNSKDGVLNSTSLQTFFSMQELYFHEIINSYVDVILNSYMTYINEYSQVIQEVFLVFLLFQLIMLFLLKGKLIQTMKDDIFQSRGILNLIPDNFFEQNRHKVEKLIIKLKD